MSLEVYARGSFLGPFLCIFSPLCLPRISFSILSWLPNLPPKKFSMFIFQKLSPCAWRNVHVALDLQSYLYIREGGNQHPEIHLDCCWDAWMMASLILSWLWCSYAFAYTSLYVPRSDCPLSTVLYWLPLRQKQFGEWLKCQLNINLCMPQMGSRAWCSLQNAEKPLFKNPFPSPGKPLAPQGSWTHEKWLWRIWQVSCHLCFTNQA